MGNKYNAKKTVCANGHVHDSGAEAKRCDELHMMQKSGLISSLKTQVRFDLIPAAKYVQDDPRMCNERGLVYIADFVYFENSSGLKIIEDVKGMRTADYIIKRKIMKYMHCRQGDTVFIETGRARKGRWRR
jgi:hypothetical protein